jgi:hypothetical protein
MIPEMEKSFSGRYRAVSASRLAEDSCFGEVAAMGSANFIGAESTAKKELYHLRNEQVEPDHEIPIASAPIRCIEPLRQTRKSAGARRFLAIGRRFPGVSPRDF